MDKRRVRALDFTLQDVERALHSEDPKEASTLLDQWLWEYPNDPKALYLLGDMFSLSGHYSYALHIFEKVVKIEPMLPLAWEGLGKCQDLLNMHDEAIKSYTRAYTITNDPNQLVNISRAYANKRDADKAEKFALEALRLLPGDRQAAFSLGWAQLFKKDLTGWVNYYEGIGSAQREVRNYVGEPEWNGEPGKKLIVYGEQGMGDEICFSSAIPDVMNDCEVILDISPRLVKLYERSFPGVEIHGTRFNKELDWEMPVIDASVMMSGLFKFYRTEGYPGTPFLKPNERQVQSIKRRHRKGKKLIGLAWTGGLPATKRRERTLSLDMLAPIYTQDATFISLEYVPKDLSNVPIRYTEEAWSDDMDDVASLVAACDLVISVPTTVVHLAGALGVPCWAMVHENPTVFYGLEGGLDIWNSVEAFRKKGDWSQVITEVAARLESYLMRKDAA